MKSANGASAEVVTRSAAAEEATLGSLLLDVRAWRSVSELVRSEDFTRSDHQLIFDAIAAQAAVGQAVDPVTIADRLEREHQLDAAGGLGYLQRLRIETPTAEHVLEYAKAVRDRAVRRRLDDALSHSPEAAELIEQLERELVRLKPGSLATAVAPLPIEPVAQWTERPAPAPRDWVLEGLVPARRLTSFLSDGGLGKTTIAVQISVHTAVSRALYGLAVNGGPVLGIFCEDEPEELERRVRAACAAERIELGELERLVIISRDGEDNVLCTFENDRMVLTPFYHQLDATVAQFQPRLLVLDTLADLYGGKYLETTHVRQFTKTALGGLCRRYGCAVLLVAHPSSSGIASGDGGGFSTAWHNSVRSRLYLRRPKSEDAEAAADRRVLELKKANYGPSGVSVPLLWRAGTFVPDREPIEETVKAPKVDTGLAIAARDYFLAKASDGSVVGFGAIYDALKARGAIKADAKEETARKALGRALAELVKARTLTKTKVPRGYRLSESDLGTLGQTRDNFGTAETSGHRDTRDTPTGQGCPCPEMSLTDVPADLSRESPTGEAAE